MSLVFPQAAAETDRARSPHTTTSTTGAPPLGRDAQNERRAKHTCRHACADARTPRAQRAPRNVRAASQRCRGVHDSRRRCGDVRRR